jgi:hypothetical protein
MAGIKYGSFALSLPSVDTTASFAEHVRGAGI